MCIVEIEKNIVEVHGINYILFRYIHNFFQSGNFIPTGDSEKAAKVMLDLVEHPEPPIRLILGSEAIGMLKKPIL